MHTILWLPVSVAVIDVVVQQASVMYGLDIHLDTNSCVYVLMRDVAPTDCCN